MACTIQAVQFQKNGTTNIPTCAATLADNIGFDATVSFTPAEVGQSYFCWFDVAWPDGTSKSFYTSSTPAYIPSSGTYDFVINKFIQSSDPTGQYSIISCYIYRSVGGQPDPQAIPVCSVFPANGPGCLASGNYCPGGTCYTVPTLTVSAAPPATIVNGEFLINGARQNSPCSDNLTDINNISVKISVNNFSSIGLSIRVGFVITDDNGLHQTSGWLTTSNTSLNQDFIIPLSNASINTPAGTHTFVNFKVVNAQNAGIVYAEGLGAGQGCQSLTLLSCSVPIVSVTCPSSIIQGSTGSILATIGTPSGTSPYIYKLYRDDETTPIATYPTTGTITNTSHPFSHTFSESVASHTFRVDVTDSCATPGPQTGSGSCSVAIQSTGACTAPVVSVTCPTAQAQGSIANIVSTITTAGTSPYVYRLYRDAETIPIDTYPTNGTTTETTHTFQHTLSESTTAHAFKVEVTDSCSSGNLVGVDVCAITVQQVTPTAGMGAGIIIIAVAAAAAVVLMRKK